MLLMINFCAVVQNRINISAFSGIGFVKFKINYFLKNLIVVGHPDVNSFCYNGIFQTIKDLIENSGQELEIIDLYRDSFTRPRDKVIANYQNLVTWCERMYIISPVWWFRLTPRTEIFFDEVLTPGFAYKLSLIHI